MLMLSGVALRVYQLSKMLNCSLIQGTKNTMRLLIQRQTSVQTSMRSHCMSWGKQNCKPGRSTAPGNTSYLLLEDMALTSRRYVIIPCTLRAIASWGLDYGVHTSPGVRISVDLFFFLLPLYRITSYVTTPTPNCTIYLIHYAKSRYSEFYRLQNLLRPLHLPATGRTSRTCLCP
ncbi:uncharacterized protein BDZ99DRAFT_34988 [Mytilinidion resinicola]|uniref:Uncharacterized protein n=1 Tax=Mytilinidion resinicola TaxID=574789 RepID=A0A6A6YLQ2_9PEZI|nr:uncharacterized protein BDZ99DRAFT_34988 [Mytilinidion resinicola]KAF2809711.1 hypothetical protein BDZ99DRAFT_34988 [Mytilinidion resinicola]